MAPTKSKKPKKQGQAVVTISPVLLRFELEDVFINQRHNNFRDPQLVLKSQLDRSRGMPYNAGINSQMPICHHQLMIHIKDKADELVKLELEDFTPAAKAMDPPSQCTAAYSPSERAFMFWYPVGPERASLLFSMKSTSDFENVLNEMKRWEVTMASSRHGFGHGYWIRREQQGLPSIAQINPLTVAKPSTRRLRRNITNVRPGLLIDPNNPHLVHSVSITNQLAKSSQSVQHLRQPLYLQPPQEWAPGRLLHRSASTIAVSGMLEEGVYKISKLKSNPIDQFGMRRLPSSTAGEVAPTLPTQLKIARQTSGLSSSTVNATRGSTVEQLRRRSRVRLSQFSKHYMAGLTEATRIWNEHMRRGKEESDLVSNLEEKVRIWMRHARVCYRDLHKVEAATKRRMRGQPVGTGTLRRLPKLGVGSHFPPNVPFASGRPMIQSTPQSIMIPPAPAGTFPLATPSPMLSSRSAVFSFLRPRSHFVLPKQFSSLTATTPSSPSTTGIWGESVSASGFL
ncbi:hypothetical protein QR685DRAFT_572887 [Neurospora intermedia]|uniref:Uncharacterized protein n=1 Tax=Neurospora intermedia TaxID=5142 RepID=A0ABR3DBD4_NEUIN